jgi:hypothetical protein
MHRTVMFCQVVGTIGGSGSPVVLELVLCATAKKPIVSLDHYFSTMWLYVVGDDAKCFSVVGLNGHQRLFVSHFTQ